MNTLLKLLILLLAAYGAYAFVQEYWVVQDVEIVPQKSSAPSVSIKVIECPSCSGLGKLIDTSGDKEIGYTCKICNGNGNIKRSAGEACPYCKGFGRIETGTRSGSGGSTITRTMSSRIMVQTCPICNGSGNRPKSTL